MWWCVYQVSDNRSKRIGRDNSGNFLVRCRFVNGKVIGRDSSGCWKNCSGNSISGGCWKRCRVNWIRMIDRETSRKIVRDNSSFFMSIEVQWVVD